jgi:CBS domain-containing protein
MSTLREVMSPDVIALSPSMSIAEAAAQLERSDVTGAPVVEAGRVVGILSTSDLREELAKRSDREVPLELSGRRADLARVFALAHRTQGPLAHGGDGASGAAWARPEPRPRLVAEIMSRRLIRLPPDADLSDAAEVMKTEGVHRVLVMDGDALLGVVSAFDIAKAVADKAEHEHELPRIDAAPIEHRDEC